MRTFTLAERRARLARRHFLSRPAASVTEATASFVGLHATDPSTPYLSLWARLPGFAVDDLDTELYQQRTLLKHLAMRRTLWVCAPRTCRWCRPEPATGWPAMNSANSSATW